VLANKVHDAPAAIALLDVRERERRNLGSTQPAAEKNGKNSAIAQPTHRCDIRRIQEALRLAH
jgi:hypothetical protein